MFSRINAVNRDKSLHVLRKVARLHVQGKCHPGGPYTVAVHCDPYSLAEAGLVSGVRTKLFYSSPCGKQAQGEEKARLYVLGTTASHGAYHRAWLLALCGN